MTFLLYAGPLALAAVVGYLLGSVNWSIILTWFFKNKEDIRKYGSGNAGMTNVLRTVGKVPAALTFVGDFLKWPPCSWRCSSPSCSPPSPGWPTLRNFPA